MPTYVHYGCGVQAPTTWQNFDASPTLVFERLPLIGRLYTRNAVRFPKHVRYGDITRGLPIAPETCAGIYASHVLEHLSLHEFRLALKNTYTLLMPGGVFQLVVPDIEQLVRRYLESDAPTAAHTLMNDTVMGWHTRPHGLMGLITLWMGHSHHLWMWDFKALLQELSQVGFGEIQRINFGDFEDPMFEQVQHPFQFMGAVGVQCCRPDTKAGSQTATTTARATEAVT